MLVLFRNVPRLKKIAPWLAPSKNAWISPGSGCVGLIWAPPILMRPGIAGLGSDILRCAYTNVSDIFLFKLLKDGSGAESAKCFSATAVCRGMNINGRTTAASKTDKTTLYKRWAKVIWSLKSRILCGTCDQGVAKPIRQSKKSDVPYVPAHKNTAVNNLCAKTKFESLALGVQQRCSWFL